MPWESGVAITPLPGPHRTAYMTEALDDARATGRAGGQRRRRRVLPDAVLSGRGVPGARRHEAVPRGAVRPAHSGDAVRRCRDRARVRDHVRSRPAGQHLRQRPGADRRAGRSAGQPGLPRQPQRAMPARPRRVPVRRPQGFGRRHAVGQPTRCARSRSARWWPPRAPRRASSCSTRSCSSTGRSSSTPASSSERGEHACDANATPRSSPRSGRRAPITPPSARCSTPAPTCSGLNFSHGSHEQHKERLEIIRRVERETGRPIAVLLDLQGPKLRIGTLRRRAGRAEAGAAFRLDLDPAPGDASARTAAAPRDLRRAAARQRPAARRRQAAACACRRAAPTSPRHASSPADRCRSARASTCRRCCCRSRR